MKHRKTVVGIIPVRGGSKGVPNKNLREIGGNPLLWYTGNAALNSNALSQVFVSTDDDVIANYAMNLGIEVLRHPPTLSEDESPTYPVIQWDLAELERLGVAPTSVAVLRATTPFRTSTDIDACVEILEGDMEADSVVSVTLAEGGHPLRLKRLLKSGYLVAAFEEEGFFPIQRQKLEPLYIRNGGVYLARTHVIKEMGLWGRACRAYVMPEARSLNINTEFQLYLANLLAQAQSP